MPKHGKCVSGLAEALPMPKLELRPPLNLELEQVKMRHLGQSRCTGQDVGQRKVARFYGSIRCFPGTHSVSPMMTHRNWYDLPQCVAYDAKCIMALKDLNGNQPLRATTGM